MLSIIAYLLILLVTFIILTPVAFIIRLILVGLFTKLYASIASNNPIKVVQFSIKSAQPMGFVTSLIHGYLAIQCGIIILRGIGLQIDIFLPVFIGAAFLFFGIRRITTPADIKVNESDNVIQHNDQMKIILDKDAHDPEAAEDPMKEMKDKMNANIKNQLQDFMQGNSTVVLIGRVTGVVLGALPIIKAFLA